MSEENALALSIDIGTSSTRVLLWDTSGREVGKVKAQIQYQMHTSPDGGMEIEAEELLKHVGECVDAALAQAGSKAKNIRAIGISTFWHALLAIDKEAKPLTPIFNWADNRSAAIAHRLRHELDGEAIHARTGCVLHPSYYPAKITWFRETFPKLEDKVDRWISPSEYLFGRLFGKNNIRVSTSMASGTGLYNQAERRWDTETLKALKIDAGSLSRIVDLAECSQGLTPEFANRWPALKDIPFFPAVGDGACGNIGSGCGAPDRFAINLGTSGAIRAVWTEPEVISETHLEESKSASANRNINQMTPPEGLWRYRVDLKRPIIGAAFSDGGHVFAWMGKTLQLPPQPDLENQIAAMTPGSHGLTFLPFLAGERSMGWNPDARASIHGMNLDTSPVELLRCSMEAVSLQFALAAGRLRTLFPHANKIVGSGGALGHSPAWCQMFADAIGSPLTLAAEAEASSRGAALLAMEAAGLIKSAEHAPARMGRTIDPDTKAHALYMEILDKQQVLYARLKGL